MFNFNSKKSENDNIIFSAEYVPQEILEKEKQSCLRRRVQPF